MDHYLSLLNVHLIFSLCILNLTCGVWVFLDFLNGFSVLPPNLVRFCGFGNPSGPPPGSKIEARVENYENIMRALGTVLIQYQYGF